MSDASLLSNTRAERLVSPQPWGLLRQVSEKARPGCCPAAAPRRARGQEAAAPLSAGRGVEWGPRVRGAGAAARDERARGSAGSAETGGPSCSR